MSCPRPKLTELLAYARYKRAIVRENVYETKGKNVKFTFLDVGKKLKL